MKIRFFIIIFAAFLSWSNMVFAQVVTETPSEKVSLIQKVKTTVSDIQTKVTTSTVVTKTSAAIGSAKNSVSSYMQKAQAEIQKRQKQISDYKAKAERYKAKMEKAKAKAEKTKNKVTQKIEQAKNKAQELKEEAKGFKNTAQNVKNLAKNVGNDLKNQAQQTLGVQKIVSEFDDRGKETTPHKTALENKFEKEMKTAAEEGQYNQTRKEQGDSLKDGTVARSNNYSTDQGKYGSFLPTRSAFTAGQLAERKQEEGATGSVGFLESSPNKNTEKNLANSFEDFRKEKKETNFSDDLMTSSTESSPEIEDNVSEKTVETIQKLPKLENVDKDVLAKQVESKKIEELEKVLKPEEEEKTKKRGITQSGQIEKSEEIKEEIKPTRGVFKTSSGYGHITNRQMLGFADAMEILTGETEEGVPIINDEMGEEKSLAEVCDLNYRTAAEKGRLTGCLEDLNAIRMAPDIEEEKIAEKIKKYGVSKEEARTLLENDYINDLAARYLEAFNIYNDSLDFKNAQVDPIMTAHIKENTNAIKMVKEGEKIIAERMSILSKLHARWLATRIKKTYLEYSFLPDEEETSAEN